MDVRGPKTDSLYTLPFPVGSGPPGFSSSLGRHVPGHELTRIRAPEVNAPIWYWYSILPDPVFHLRKLRPGKGLPILFFNLGASPPSPHACGGLVPSLSCLAFRGPPQSWGLGGEAPKLKKKEKETDMVNGQRRAKCQHF